MKRPASRLFSSPMSALRSHAAQHKAQEHTHPLLLFLLLFGSCTFAAPAYSQIQQEETLGGPDSHETGQGPHGHLFGGGTAKDRGWKSEVSGSISNT
jgi:hypothetical protein